LPPTAARGSRLAVLGARCSSASLRSALGTRHSRRGFTLIEILIVVTIIGILVTLAQPSFNRAVTSAKEATLKENLFILRDVIDQFYADNTKYPTALSELVEKGYIRQIPKDPITGSAESWAIVPATDEQGQSVGIYDVKSGSDRTARDGSRYSDW
jgi:general secretion pathway protein G